MQSVRAMIIQPSDPKRAVEGPQRQAQLRRFRRGRSASAARKSSESAASARRPSRWELALLGSAADLCGQARSGTALRRAQQRAERVRMRGRWGAGARGWRVRQPFPGRKRNRCRRWGATVPQRQGLDGSFRGEGGGQRPRCRLCLRVWKSARRDPTQSGAPSRMPTTTCNCYFHPTSRVTPSVILWAAFAPPSLLSLPQPPPFALRSSVPREMTPREAPEVGVHQIGQAKSKAQATAGRADPASDEGASVPGARGDLELAGGRWGGRGSCLEKVEKIPQLPTRSCFFFFCCLLLGAGAGSWTRAEPQKSDKDKPWAPSPRSGAQDAGAPLTGRSLRSNEKVKRVQMLVAHHWQFP